MTTTDHAPYHRTERAPDALRPLALSTAVLIHPEGSAEISFGRTRVLCTASVENRVPPFAEEEGKGWVTAEYAMLPRSTNTRGRRGQNSRAKEISRLVGRTLRQAVDLSKLQGFTVTVDCDVLQADGGTRTAAITGGYVALHQAVSALIAAGKVPADALAEPVEPRRRRGPPPEDEDAEHPGEADQPDHPPFRARVLAGRDEDVGDAQDQKEGPEREDCAGDVLDPGRGVGADVHGAPAGGRYYVLIGSRLRGFGDSRRAGASDQWATVVPCPSARPASARSV